MLIQLKKKDAPAYRDPRIFHWTKCAPFVENKRGKLIHRPRSGATYQLHKSGPHIGITFWCGMTVTDNGGKLTLLDAPPEHSILCERCEEIAVTNGLPSADELAGRHVHKMTKFKIYRVNSIGHATVEIVEAYDWSSLFSMYQYNGNPIFKIEVVGGLEPQEKT